MFGGPCRAADFANEHPTPNANKTAEGLYDTAPLQGFHDDSGLHLNVVCCMYGLLKA